MLMVLRKLGEPLAKPVMQQLYLHLINNLPSCDMDALSYMTVALRYAFIFRVSSFLLYDSCTQVAIYFRVSSFRVKNTNFSSLLIG
jgi:hypothetical protein